MSSVGTGDTVAGVVGVLDPLEDLLGGNEEDPMPDRAAEYQACKQAVVDARQAWAAAERNRDSDAMAQALEDLSFSLCCVVAAGEAFKGESFEQVTARHEGSA